MLAAIALAGAGGAQAATSCFGVGVDAGYRAAFDTVRGQSANSSVDYPQGRFYREAQSWATPVGADPGHHSEHMHLAACLPNGQKMTGAFDLDLAYTFHNVQDYRILNASMSAVTRPDGNSTSLWQATPAQIAELQTAMDASGDGAVKRVFFSVRTTLPTRNGFKEIRGAIATEEDGPLAIFHTWHFDPRWYLTDAVPGLPTYAGIGLNQNALRNRSQITSRRADGTITNVDYHHSGWCGMDGNYAISPELTPVDRHTDCTSARWTRATVSVPWAPTVDKRFQLYVTDGGGDAFLMIDPDFHNHYAAPTAACPNVDASGNCLGKWVWRPPNARQELFNQFAEVTIPASVIASLSSGLHKLVFLSNDAPECERAGNPCPPDARGEWSNVEVLPFKR